MRISMSFYTWNNYVRIICWKSSIQRIIRKYKNIAYHSILLGLYYFHIGILLIHLFVLFSIVIPVKNSANNLFVHNLCDFLFSSVKYVFEISSSIENMLVGVFILFRIAIFRNSFQFFSRYRFDISISNTTKLLYSICYFIL